jgi:peroxiredoxin
MTMLTMLLLLACARTDPEGADPVRVPADAPSEVAEEPRADEPVLPQDPADDPEEPGPAEPDPTEPDPTEPDPAGGSTDTDPADTDPADPPAPTDADPSDPPDPLVPCDGWTVGTAIGECTPDFSLLDADGVAWRLYDHAGDVIVVDFSAMWCPHCVNLADDLEALHVELAAQGLTVVTVLHEDLSSQPPDAADLRQWSSTLGLTHAVLADPGAIVEATWGGYYQPNVVVIGRDGVVDWRSTGGAATAGLEEAVRAAL